MKIDRKTRKLREKVITLARKSNKLCFLKKGVLTTAASIATGSATAPTTTTSTTKQKTTTTTKFPAAPPTTFITSTCCPSGWIHFNQTNYCYLLSIVTLFISFILYKLGLK